MPLHQYNKELRLIRGDRSFLRTLLEKVKENNPTEIAALPPEKLYERLMELAAELLNKNINNKANFWHYRTQDDDLVRAGELVNNLVNDIQDTVPDDDYNAYIDLIRTLSQQDQEGPPGSGILQQDLFYQHEGPAQIGLQGNFDVRVTGAQIGPLPVKNPLRRKSINSNSNRKP